MTAMLQTGIKYSIDWVFYAWHNVWRLYYCAIYWLWR